MRTCSPPGTNGAVTNFELRTFDGCANPPLGFAALLVAGIDGLRNNLKIADPAEPEDYDLFFITMTRTKIQDYQHHLVAL